MILFLIFEPLYLKFNSCAEEPALCNDCSINTSDLDEWYMVHEKIWIEAGLNPEEDGDFLCIGCLESRLRRTLKSGDFTHVPVNNFTKSKTSSRMLDRLTTPS